MLTRFLIVIGVASMLVAVVLTVSGLIASFRERRQRTAGAVPSPARRRVE